jgi:NADH-quinone oxidoreductase subunit M
MTGFPILSLMTFLPLVGVVAMLFLKGLEESVALKSRYIALFVSLVVFGLSVVMLAAFDPESAAFQFVERKAWFTDIGISYHMGVDGISVFFVVLSAFLTPICILASWTSITKRVREYMIAFLVLETLMIGTFCALDAILFYACFEGVLIPMFLVIGVWGGPRRVYSAYKFFLYTLLGSVFMLVALLTMYVQVGTTDIPTLMTASYDPSLQKWLWLALFASFVVKMPLWPVHTWLPDAHVEAPTAGSAILAGILLKMGGYGFLRFLLPMLPDATEAFREFVFLLSIVAVMYASLVALVQEDVKKMIAYSSVAHMGFVSLGSVTLTVQGIQGGIFQMLSHGLISAALFLCVGVIYDRLHTREIVKYGGIARNMPKYAALFMIFMMGSVGLPGTSGFVGEFLVLVGAYQVSTIAATLAASAIVLGAIYMLYLYRRVLFGPQTNPEAAAMPDLNRREILYLLPIALLVLWMGIAPNYVLKRMEPSVERLISEYQSKRTTPSQIGAESHVDNAVILPQQIEEIPQAVPEEPLSSNGASEEPRSAE